MKKYNLSKIMKRAWSIVRKLKNTFSEALRMSWKMAKFEVAIKKEWYRPEGTVEFNVWQGYGYVRAYYKCSWMSKYQNNKKTSYIDLLD